MLQNIFVLLVLYALQLSAADSQSAGLNHQCSSVAPENRLECYIGKDATLEKCSNLGCCWNEGGKRRGGSPSCYFPSGHIGYNVTIVNQERDALTLKLHRSKPSGYPNDISNVVVQVNGISNTMVRIKVYDENKERFAPSFPKLNVPNKGVAKALYNITVDADGQLFVRRLSTGKVVFRSDLRQLIFADQFLQLSSSLPSDYVYGLGEHKAPFRKGTNWELYTFWNSDVFPEPGMPLYGSHPFHFAVEDDDGHASGVFIFNSNAMDVILSPAPAVTYRPIGGILDFYVLVNESPEKLVQDYISLVGLPPMPPLWALGFHLCKWDYGSLEETIKAWNRTRNAQIPLEAQWIDIDYMDNFDDFTYDKKTFRGLPEFVKHLHEIGMRMVIILDPGVSAAEPIGTHPPYDEGIKMDIFVKNASDQILLARVWNQKGKTVFPDYSHPNITEYWTKLVRDFHSVVEFDGLWIDMNEPANFLDGSAHGCPDSPLENPPYVPGERPLITKTLCLTAKHHGGLHYDTHNLFATYQSRATYRALEQTRKGKRPFVISRASSPGLGHYATHWNGDIASTWDDMQWSIPAAMEFNIFGMPLFGSDICGFNYNTTEELCARWQSLGSFYPFSRNHNSKFSIDQDPAILGPVVVNATKFGLNLRYKLLPYLYTLFHRAHKFGETVARPVFFVYPKDVRARSIETQFMWGDALMIVPVLEAKVTSVKGYIPKGRWYFVDSFKAITSGGEDVTFDTPMGYINVLLRGGKIITVAEGDLRLTKELYQVPFNLIVALDENEKASGELFWDDGEAIDSLEKGEYNRVAFEAQNNTLVVTPVVKGYHGTQSLSKVVILGLHTRPTRATVNGSNIEFSFDSEKHVLTMSLNTQQNIFTPILISWG